MATGPDRPVTLAAVAGAHGVRGEVRLKLFTDSVDSLRRYGRFYADGRELTLKAVRQAGGGVIARFVEITDRNVAEALRGTALVVPRAELPPLADGEYYWHDLIGMAVFSDTGAPVGHVTSVDNYGASDVIEVTRENAGPLLVPMIRAAAWVDGERLVVDSAWLE